MALALPKYVVFRGDDRQYLCARPFQDRPRLQFYTSDVTDPTVIMEIIDTNDGNLRIKDTSSGKFWIFTSPDMIFADAGEDTGNNKDTLFFPLKVNSYSIALISQGNGRFCKRYTNSRLESGLNANIDFTDRFARLKVEEPVSKREISNIEYDLDESRIYDDETVVLTKVSVINRTDSSTDADVNLTYKDIQTSHWKTGLSLKLESKALFDAVEIPFIIAGNVELVNQVEVLERNELDEPITKFTVRRRIHPVVVPPRSKVIVTLIASKAKCYVPFTFTQSDTLYNGVACRTELKGTYIGSCYYDLDIQCSTKLITAEERVAE